MKKKILLFVMSGLSVLAYAQSGQKWSVGGNSTSASDIFGTTNNQPINFTTNGTTKMILDANGKLKLMTFAGNSGSIIINNNGVLDVLAPGGANQVLFGNGTWGNLPAGNWLSSGNNLYWTAGSVGIGAAPNNSFKLDVAGDARVQNNLYVGGGVLISQKVEASNSVKTDTVHSSTGTTKFTGNVVLKQQFQVDGSTLFNGNVQASNLSIGGSITTNNNLSVAGATNLNGLIVSGPITIGSMPAALNPCLKLTVIDANNHLVALDPQTVSQLETMQDANPCPQPPPIPFVWQTYGNHVNSNNRWIGTIENFDFNIRTNNIQRMVVKADGTVGIGTKLTTNPYNYQLAVNGMIGCKSFKVEINSAAWSDFVFDKNYSLMPLSELEKFILKNKHLPNIPSNADVDANNGVDVVDVESKLLQKVEELTLYIIQQQKEIDELKKKVN